MKGKKQNKGARNRPAKTAPSLDGLAAAARVLAAGGRVPKRFQKAIDAVPARPASAGPRLGEAEAWARVSPARRAAYEILLRVGEDRGHSDELLHSGLTETLSPADRNLATAFVMGVLRWQIALDARLRLLLDRPDQRLAEPVALALRLGALQLQHMDRIPAHAALSESVEICRAAGEPHATGMVNAILRRLAGTPTPAAKVFETTVAFAQRLGHPAWLVERWVANYGRDAALAICEAGQREPAAGGLFEPDAALPSIDDGSRIVAEVAALAAPRHDRPLRVWDACAAPGGKTLVLAARLAGADGQGADLLATDISPRRLAVTASRLRRHRAEARTVVADALKLPAQEGSFDLILCDLPCSGTGTLGRNPEIRLKLAPTDLARQADRQHAILTAALARLAPGGRLVYSTCSLEPEENEAVVSGLSGEWARVPAGDFIARLPGFKAPATAVERDGVLRTLPGVHPCDGFYAVVLERR